MRKAMPQFLLFLVIAAVLFALPLWIDFSGKLYALRGGLALLLLLLLGISIKKKAKFKPVLLIAQLLISLLVIVELAFMFVPQSHGLGSTYGGKIWLKKYWTVNSLGFRDTEPSNQKPTILFVGDSFTTGGGIEDPNDRFSNLVDQNFEEYQSINIGLNAADTDAKLDNLVSFIDKTQIKPKIVVLQYYGNDLERAADRNGIKFMGSENYSDLGNLSQTFVRASYFLNYLYWLSPRSSLDPYKEFVSKAYADSTVYQEHIQSMDRFVHYTKENNMELIVVVFPFIQDIPMSQELYASRIVDYLKDRKVKCIDLSPSLENLSPEELVVNPNDGHCSAMVHHIVAEKLNKVIE